ERLRTPHQRLGEQESLLLAAREAADRLVRVPFRSYRLDGAVDGAVVDLADKIDPPSRSVEAEVHEVPPADRQLGVELRALRDVANPRVAAAWRAAHDL